MSAYLGVDVGASTLAVVVGDETGTVHGRYRAATPQQGEGGDIVDAVLDGIRAACEDAGVDPASIVAAGIGAVGPQDAAAGAVVSPVNLPGVERIDLVDPVARLLDADVRLHNDATAAVIGERFAADGDPRNLVYLTISTGLGAGAIVDGTVLAGKFGNAAEVGHFTLDPDATLVCGCGSPGHWEAFCGGANLPAHARALAEEVDTSLDLVDCGPADLLDAAGTDPLATRLVQRLGHWNAVGVSMLVHAFDPERVVVGGGVARNHPETILEPIRDRLPTHTLRPPPPLEVTRRGDEATVRGALASAITGGDGSSPD